MQTLQANGAIDDDRLTRAAPVAGFPNARLNVSVGEFSDEADRHEDHFNLLLLVKACASLEDYLHRMVQIWAIGQGFFDANETLMLDRRGVALIKPAMVSNLESSLSYVELLLHLDFGASRSRLGKAYKLRCVAAHNGGVVDQDTLKAFPRMKDDLGKPIRLSWNELHGYLKAASDACAKLENGVRKNVRVKGELSVILGGLLKAGEAKVGDEPKSRALLIENYGFNNLPDRQGLNAILTQFRGVKGVAT